jgi:hypothetical protein
MNYDKLEYHLSGYRESCKEKGMDVDDLFLVGIITHQFVKFTGESLDTIGDTIVREHIWMDIESKYQKILDQIKNYDEDMYFQFCDEDEEKCEKYPYNYQIFLQAIKEAKKKNPNIYVTRYGIYETEIFEEYWKLYDKKIEDNKKPKPKPKHGPVPKKTASTKKDPNTIQI